MQGGNKTKAQLVEELARLRQRIAELEAAPQTELEREAELQKTNDLLRAIIEAAPTAIMGLDTEGNVQMVWNPAAERMLGWSAQEVMGKFLPTVSREKEEEFRQFRDWIQNGKSLNGVEVQRKRRDGTPIDYSIYASPLHNLEGRIIGNVAVLVDIGERKWAEKERERLLAQIRGQAQLQQQERLAAVGQLAAGIAHDFNNIMAVIVLYAQISLKMGGCPAKRANAWKSSYNRHTAPPP